MTVYTTSGLIDQIGSMRDDPARIHAYMLDLLEAMSNGEVIAMEATNPAVFLLESSAVMHCSGLVDCENKTRRLYPSMANTFDELYAHMADVDYLGIFSNPATVTLSMLLDVDEIIQKAVVDAGTGTRRLTVPRYTKVIVAGVPLTLLYPVDIRVMSHGGFTITFDVSEPTPIGQAATNLLDWSINTINDVRYLDIKIPFYQLEVTRNMAYVNAMTGYTRTFDITDNYYYTRAYIKNKSGEWTEIKTTMSDLVFNSDTPTVILKVLNNSLKVTIPQIYLNSGQINDVVRLDIYTTKGPLNIALENYALSSYAYDFTPLSDTNTDQFVAPLKNISVAGFYSSDTINGGSTGLSFDELKTQVTERSTITEGLPITEKQLTRLASQMGYSIVKNIDNITDRQYLATRALPTPSSGFTATSMGVAILTLTTTFSKLKLLDSVTSSTYRLTLNPNTLYSLTDDKLGIVDSNQVRELLRLQTSNPTLLATTLNNGQYLYSPFYYVFDVKSTEILPRVYDMDSPEIKSKYFYQDNASLGINIGVRNYFIKNAPMGDGYLLDVVLDVGEVGRTLGPDYIAVQLSYIGRDEPTRYYIKGYLVSDINPSTNKPVDDLYRYQFKIETKYDIDSDDGLVPIPYRSPINLTHEFDVVTIIRDYAAETDVIASDIDGIIDLTELDNYRPMSTYYGVSQYKVALKFGSRLDKLWTRTRSSVDIREVSFYEVDVPAIYKEDVYERDANGLMKLTYDSTTGAVISNRLHEAGDYVYDETGEQIFEHYAGDPMLDDYGNPMYIDHGDGLQREIDLFLIDAAYKFSTSNEVLDYRSRSIGLITKWVTTDMTLISDQLLDRSEMFYHPPITVGQVKAIADNNLEVSLPSKQSLVIDAYLSRIDYSNVGLREALSRSIVTVLQQVLSRRVVSIDAIYTALNLAVGKQLISYTVTGFAEDKYKTLTLDSEAMALTLAKRLVVQANMSLSIEDDVTINYYAHGA